MGPWWAMNPLGSLSPQKTNHPNKTNPSEWLHGIFLRGIHKWLVVSTHLKNISQIGNLPQIGVKMKNIWNHHLDNLPHEFSYDSWRVHEGFTQAGGSQLWHRAWKIWKSLMGFFTRGVEERSWIFSVVFMSSSIYIYINIHITHTHTFVYVYINIYTYVHMMQMHSKTIVPDIIWIHFLFGHHFFLWIHSHNNLPGLFGWASFLGPIPLNQRHFSGVIRSAISSVICTSCSAQSCTAFSNCLDMDNKWTAWGRTAPGLPKYTSKV